jgi:hypothetical protein
MIIMGYAIFALVYGILVLIRSNRDKQKIINNQFKMLESYWDKVMK